MNTQSLPFSSHSSTLASSSGMSVIVMATAAYRRRIRKSAKKQRRFSFVHHLLPSRYTVTFDDISRAYGPELFKKAFRMSLSAFTFLLTLVREFIDKPFKSGTAYRRSTVPPAVRLAITLRLLAGASCVDVVVAYQVAESTVYEIFHSTCKALRARLHLKRFPHSEAALRAISMRFTSSRKDFSPLTGCVGALDGICVKIKKPEPEENPALFYCRKGFYAVPVQALVDSDYVFRFCSAKCSSATHDSLAYSVSGLKHEIDSGILGDSFYIVGAEAYTCTEELITPFPKSSADVDQDNFNFYHSSLRMHVEQAFGMLVARWRILKHGLEFSVDVSTDLICLLMKLHNFCLEYDLDSFSLWGHLPDHDKDAMEADINQWCCESRDVAREFQDNSEGSRPVHEETHIPSTSSVSRKRDRLVWLAKAKGKERPEGVLPTQHYRLNREPNATVEV